MRVFKPPYTKGGKRRTSPTYHIEFLDHRRTRHRLILFRDKISSERFADKLENLVGTVANNERPKGDLARWVERLRPDIRAKLAEWGILDEQASSLSKPLTDHADDYRAALIAKGRTDEYADLRRSRLVKLFDGCDYRQWSEIKIGAVEQWLADERNAGRMKEQTSNHYVTMLRGFCAWMVAGGRAGSSLADGLASLTVTDAEPFGVFTVAQVQTLLDYCTAATDVWGVNQRRPRPANAAHEPERFLTGPQRALVYRVACETALRANVIRTLTVAQVRLERDRTGQVVGGGVRTSVGQQKNRRAHDVPLRRDLAAMLAEQIAGKTGAVQVFDLPTHTAEMLRHDMLGAGLPLIDEDELPLRFHSFRPTCATWLGEAGLESKDIAAITGHQSRAMVDHYTHATRKTARRAIESLPAFRATGTTAENGCAMVAQGGAEDGGDRRPMSRSRYEERGTGPPAAVGLGSDNRRQLRTCSRCPQDGGARAPGRGPPGRPSRRSHV